MAFMGSWVEIPMGMQGLVTDYPSSEIPYNALIRSTNIDYAPGYLQKAPGSITYNSTNFGAGVVGCLDYWLDGVTQRTVVATADGKIWKDKGDRTFMNNTAQVTGLGTLDNRCSFVIGGAETIGNNKKIFFFSNGNKQVQVLNGDFSGGNAIALPATDWANATASTNPQGYYPKFGLIHRSRLWTFVKSNYYASNTANHEDFQTSNAILTGNIGPGEGGDITGAFVYKGTLLIFKQGDLLYQLVDTDNSSANWYFKKFGEGLSISNWHGAIQVLDDMIVGNISGSLTSLKASLNFGSFTQGDLFKTMKVSQYYRQRARPEGTTYQQTLYYPEKGKAFFTAKSGALTKNDTLIYYDVSQADTPKFGLWNHYQADCISLRRDIYNILRPMYGAADGYLYLADRETRSVNGAAYTAEFRTPYLDFRHLDPQMSEKQKAFEILAVTFTPDGNHSLSFDVWIDGKFSQTVTATQTIDSNYLGAFKLGTSTLGSEDEQTVFVPISGAGRRISLRGYNSNALESFKVSKLGIGFRLLGEDATRLAAP